MKYLKLKQILPCCILFMLLSVGISGQAVAQPNSVAELVKLAEDNGVNKTTLTELQNRAKNHGMSESQIADILKPTVGLAEQDLPAEHIIQKVLEGLSKGVPNGQLISVVSRMNSSTQQAARIVDPWMQKKEVQQMVERSDGKAGQAGVRKRMIEVSSRAISRNVSAETINQILSEISSESVLSQANSSDIIAAVNIIPDLSAGDQPQVAQSFVVRALKGGFKSGDLQKLPMAVNMAQKRSQIPAAGILKGIANQLQAGTPAAQVLQNLFKGNIGGGPPGTTPKGLINNPGQGKGQGQGQGQGQGRGQGGGN